jgi:hypothetical protein
MASLLELQSITLRFKFPCVLDGKPERRTGLHIADTQAWVMRDSDLKSGGHQRMVTLHGDGVYVMGHVRISFIIDTDVVNSVVFAVKRKCQRSLLFSRPFNTLATTSAVPGDSTTANKNQTKNTAV